MAEPSKPARYLILCAILLVAFALRMFALPETPAGLSHDEANNGITALQVLDGQHAVFFEINKGIEPLFIYLEAAAFYLFGIGPTQMRLVGVFCGLLTVALTYPLTRRLFGDRRLAMLAMAGVAISFWAIFVSRLTLRAVTLPPLLMLALYALWRGFSPTLTTRGVLLWFGLAGLATGATMYTYLSSRFVPFLLAGFFGYQLLRGRVTRAHWLGGLLLLVVWLAIFAPLGNYFWQNRASFTERADQVTVIPYALNGEVAPLLESMGLTLGMFTFMGDETDRYNLDLRPIFDWGNGLLFYLGVGLLLWRLIRAPRASSAEALLLLWLFFMLLPDFITDDSPHFLRVIGALPAVYILWAMGLLALLDWATRSALPARVPALALTALLLLTTAHTSYDYFYRWANAAEGRYIYGADIAAIAEYIKQNPSEDLTVISAEYYRDLDPFRFRLHFEGQPPFVIWFDGQQTVAFPPSESGLTPRYFFAASAPPMALWQPFLEPSDLSFDGEFGRYRLTDRIAVQEAWQTTLPAEQALNVNLNDELIIAGYQRLGTPLESRKFEVVIGWQALKTLPPGTDYTFLVRLRDETGRLWSEADGNGYPPDDWQPGVVGLQRLTLRLEEDLPVGAYQLTLEVVDRRTGQPLATPQGETVIVLEGLRP